MLAHRKQTLFLNNLKRLYYRLDHTLFPCHSSFSTKVQFFRQAQGEFLKICRLKKGVSLEEAASLINISHAQMRTIEKGINKITDTDFFRLAGLLGCSTEVSIFVEKVEEALKPGLREAKVLLLIP